MRATHLETNSSRLSCSDNARWSFKPAPLAPELDPFSNFSVLELPVTTGALPLPLAVALPFACTSLGCGRLSENVPSRILSKSKGVGGARLRHMSAMDRRLRMSEWKTCRRPHEIATWQDPGQREQRTNWTET